MEETGDWIEKESIEKYTGCEVASMPTDTLDWIPLLKKWLGSERLGLGSQDSHVQKEIEDLGVAAACSACRCWGLVKVEDGKTTLPWQERELSARNTPRTNMTTTSMNELVLIASVD
ncbi:hypothetical protein FRX31_020530 [Thalictrum thalictroides]|uniref:Uncharacterized protein n=1 Tax=Thalictrum thalictroides TaxID=46969 RepID=A0A7J6VYE9_THATH|nr:hypothetical protein FRX31_020530 [Thalictrum thalictroides]